MKKVMYELADALPPEKEEFGSGMKQKTIQSNLLQKAASLLYNPLVMENNEFTFKVGDTINVFQKVTEGERQRTIGFKGQVIKVRGRGENKTFIVRQNLGGVEVDRIFPLSSPTISKIEFVAKPKYKVRRARLLTNSSKKK